MIPYSNFKSKNAIIDRNISVTFSGTPSYFNVTKSIVRFDKTFAFGWSMDDSLIDASNIALPAFNGGNVIHKDGVVLNYPGMFYTDGCGNDVPFRFELKTVGSLITTGTSTNYMNYRAFRNAYVNGCHYINHSFSHKDSDGDFSLDPQTKEQEIIAEVINNYDIIKLNTGIRMLSFSTPTNYAPYFPIVYQMYLAKNKVNRLAYMRPDLSTTLRQNYPCENNTMEFYSTLTDIGSGAIRDFTTWQDTTITSTPADVAHIEEIISGTTNNAHYWFSAASHGLGSNMGTGDTYASAGFRWLTFQSFFERLQSTYGKTGLDNMWMDNDTNIWEYIQCYKFTTINVLDISPTQKKISVDFSQCNSEFRFHTTSFVISTDVNISNVVINGFDSSSYKINYKSLGNGNVLVNVQYSPQYETALYKRLNALVDVETLEATALEADKIIAQETVNLLNTGSYKTSLQIRIDSVQIPPDAVTAKIDFGSNITGNVTPAPWNNIAFPVATPIPTGTTITNLLSSNSQATGWAVTVTHAFTATMSSAPSDDGTLLYPNSAHKDGFTVTAGVGAYGELTFSNLNPAKKYDLKLYGTRMISSIQKWTVNGVTQTFNIQNNRNVTVDFLNNTGTSTIIVKIEGNTSTITPYIGVIEIIEHL